MLRLGRFREHRHSRFGNAVILAFLVAQAADGLLTYLGVQTFGRGIEGNPLLVWFMQAVGDGPALASAKLTAATLGGALHLMTVHRVVAILTAVYVVGAISPWVYLLAPVLRALF
jgi:nitrate reductase gamma subunit